MTKFNFPGHLATSRPDAFGAYVADVLRTNLDYPCKLLIHYDQATNEHVFETRDELAAFAEAVAP